MTILELIGLLERLQAAMQHYRYTDDDATEAQSQVEGIVEELWEALAPTDDGDTPDLSSLRALVVNS